MKKTGLAVLSALFMFSYAPAQKKELDLAQSWGQKQSITKPINQVIGWKDAEHYLERDAQDGKVYAVHIKSQKRKAYTPEPNRDVRVFTREGDIFIRYGDGSEQQLTHSPEEKEENPTLSPDNKQVAFTLKGDLYSLDVESKETVRYTHDGSDVVYNGWSSWVYYEEILGRPTEYKAFWWSPDSKKIAFMRFDDSQVPVFPIYASKGQHGYLEQTRYPKAGDENPEVRIGLVELKGSDIVWADFNEKEDQYFGQPYWAYDSESIMIQWMNRDQTDLKFYYVDPTSGAKQEFYHEHQDTWINLDHSERITFLEDNKHYILKSDKTGWAHYYLYKLDGELVNPLTSGEWQVEKIQHIDEKGKVLFFTARKENSTRFDLYRVDFSGKNLKRLTFGDYYHQVSPSPDGKHFITTYSNVTTPTKIALINSKGKVLAEIADSKSEDFDNYNIGKTELLRIASEDGQYQLPLVITYPVDFDPNKEYPVIMSIYGGPDAGTVYDRWSGTANQYWAKEGIIQVAADHRASGHFGKKGVSLMHRNLGYWEMIDYQTVAKWLKDKPFVKNDKLLITGHSYGGYITCLALTKSSDYFDYGIAGAPVTSWELYDTHYTERFMDRPQDNPEGYKSGSVLTYVDKYKGGLRLLHGDLDDNVHLQQTTQLVDALTDGDIPFELMIYPGSRHGFGPSKRKYDFKERARFYYQYLLEKPLPEHF